MVTDACDQLCADLLANKIENLGKVEDAPVKEQMKEKFMKSMSTMFAQKMITQMIG